MCVCVCNTHTHTHTNTHTHSARSEEAIDAYIKALDIKPNYVRALANLGIAYSNQVSTN